MGEGFGAGGVDGGEVRGGRRREGDGYLVLGRGLRYRTEVQGGEEVEIETLGKSKEGYTVGEPEDRRNGGLLISIYIGRGTGRGRRRRGFLGFIFPSLFNIFILSGLGAGGWEIIGGHWEDSI